MENKNENLKEVQLYTTDRVQPWQFLKVHRSLLQLVDTIILMEVNDFASLQISSQFYHPWSAQTSMFFTLSEQVVMVKDKGETNFITYPANFIMGPNLVERIVQCPNNHYVLGINFKPGALHRITGLSIGGLVNQVIEASTIFGKTIHQLSWQLQNASAQNEILTLIEDFFIDRIDQIQPISQYDLAIIALVKANGNMPMEKVAELACLSERQFERKSMERLGMLPKLFARLTRFSKAYGMKEANPDIHWSKIVHQCGYFDQMHLIRDFKTFSGTTPTIVEQNIQNTINAVTAFKNT